ncbi:MAG: DUF3810 domain-containing protein [Clostridia bacterium]|nr:DUF3810 domain-containing protein [Clostridia bacterium]
MFSKKVPKRVRNYEKFTPLFYVLCGIALLALILLIIAVCSPTFANGYNSTVGAFFRAVLAHLTSWLPFSLAEMLLYSTPILLTVTVIYAYRRRCGSWKSTLVFIASVLAVVSILFSLFVFGFGIGYHTDPLDRRIGLERRAVGTEELHETALWLAEETNKAADGVRFGEDRFSAMPYDRDEMGDLLIAAYERVCDDYDFIQRLDSDLKPVLASEVMSYMHITGVYSFFTGEANINVNFPDYTIPYTAAHELAHQRGIAREDEANFVAFLVTSASEDVYIRYSGYLNLLEYVLNALYRADAEAYAEVFRTMKPCVIGELRAYSEFFDAYRDTGLSEVSGAVNDAYLKLNGNEAGTASYGLVVDLAVAWKKARIS